MSKQKIPNVQIELTNLCNAKCVICPVSDMKRKRKIMDFNLFKKIIDDLSKIEYNGMVSPFLEGESLLISNIFDYLRYIRKKLPKATIGLYTNGSKLTREVSETIRKEHLLDELGVSFDGGTKEAFETVRRGLLFEEVRDNVKYFLKIRGDYQPIRVSILMVVTKENYKTKSDLKRLFSDADVVSFHKRFNWAGQHGSKKSPSFWATQNYYQRMESVITILVDGRVALCCFDYEGKEIIGDVKNESVMKIWNGDELNKKIFYLKNRNFDRLPLCANCDFIRHNILSRQIIKMERIINKFPFFYNLLKNIWIGKG